MGNKYKYREDWLISQDNGDKPISDQSIISLTDSLDSQINGSVFDD